MYIGSKRGESESGGGWGGTIASCIATVNLSVRNQPGSAARSGTGQRYGKAAQNRATMPREGGIRSDFFFDKLPPVSLRAQRETTAHMPSNFLF